MADVPADKFVTHGEFSQFREYVGGQFAAMQRDSESKHSETMDAIKAIRSEVSPKPTNWTAIIGSFGGIAGFGFAFLALWMRPMEQNIDTLRRNQSEIMHKVEEAGKDRFTGSDGDALGDRVTRSETILKLNGLDIPFPLRKLEGKE